MEPSQPVTPANPGPFSTPTPTGAGGAPFGPAPSHAPAGSGSPLPTGGPLAGGGGQSPLGKLGGLGGGVGGGNPMMVVLIAVLGGGALIFAILTFVFYDKATKATTTLNAQKAEAAASARKEQKKADDESFELANQTPFRSYVAPVQFGSFEIKFPKNWSGRVDHAQSGKQVDLILNPDFVRRTNGADELAATRIQLQDRPLDQFARNYDTYIKQGKLKRSDITVSGQKGYDLTGEFNDKRTSRMVIVPIRDKVLVFFIENSKYATEFSQILAQAKIIP